MFLASYKQDKKQYNNIYYNYDEFYKDTFSPKTQDINILSFKVSGKTYNEKKENARNNAINYQLNFSNLNWSYLELNMIESYFQKVGKKYGLLKEFKENCVI